MFLLFLHLVVSWHLYPIPPALWGPQTAKESYARVSGTQEEQFTCSSRKNKGLSVLMHAIFSSSKTNSTNQTGLRASKELQNTVLKLQSTVSRHVGLSRELQIHLNCRIFKTFFPPFTLELFFISKTEQTNSRRQCRRRMPEWGLKTW